MTITDFATVLGTLAVATNKELDDETIDVYFAALRDVPFDTLKAGVGRTMTSSRFFPSVGEIRRACDLENAGNWHKAAMPALPPAALPDDDPRVWYACVMCQDSGWASHWCTGSKHEQPKRAEAWVSIGACGSSACARFGSRGYGHEFMKRCVCYLTNPKIRERLEARRKFAEPDS